ncbi:MAG: PQQ-binding-like beta-propeller repeat protein [Pirellulales bacterium]
MKRPPRAYLVVCFSLLSTSQLFGFQAFKDSTGWSQFRGPNGSGVATTGQLPIEFNKEKNLKWMTELPEGHSSPVIFERHIFLSAIENDSLLTICVDKTTGAEVWRRSATGDRKEKIDSRNNPASPTPVVDSSGVYVFFPDLGLIAYSVTGEMKWQTKIGPFSNLYGMGASPIICNGRLILVCDQNLDSYIAAFDLKNGELIWKTKRPEATSGHCSPILYQPPQGEPQVIAAGSFYLTAYSVATGNKLWWVGGLCFEMKSTPIIHGDLVYINGYGSPQNEEDASFKIGEFAEVLSKQDSNRDGKLNLAEMPDALSKDFFPAVDLDGDGNLDSREWDYFRNSLASKNSLMAIRLNGSGDMTTKNIVWKYYRNIPQLPSPLFTNEKLFMISDAGIVSCLDPLKGTLLKRGRLQGAAGNVYASPVVADNKIFFVTLDGKVAVTDTSSEFNILAVNDLREPCYATPAFDSNRIFIRTQRGLYAFGL